MFALCFGCSGATWAANEANATNETGWAGISICVDTRLIKLYNAFTISFHFFVQAGCTYAVGTIGGMVPGTIYALVKMLISLGVRVGISQGQYCQVEGIEPVPSGFIH